MREVGVDISGQRSKHVDEFAAERFNVVVTVCDDDWAGRRARCLRGLGGVVHRSFDDPPRLAATAAGEEAMSHYRRVRDRARWAAWKPGFDRAATSPGR